MKYFLVTILIFRVKILKMESHNLNIPNLISLNVYIKSISNKVCKGFHIKYVILRNYINWNEYSGH